MAQTLNSAAVNARAPAKIRQALRRTTPILALAILAACSRQQVAGEEARQVRTTTAQSGSTALVLEYPGEVRPRVESRLGFRVGGKIIERGVEVGQLVSAGQLLARLDPQDLRLAQANARAQLDAAETDKKLAESEYLRYADLYRQNFISLAELDRRKSAREAADARFESAHAGFRNQANQTEYADLRSDVAGVVTAVEAEAGQVVSAGQTIVHVARAGDAEIAIAVPEDKVAVVRELGTAVITLWAVPGVKFPAKVREVAASADPATRTYLVKLALDKSTAAQGTSIRLGMTATVRFEESKGAAITGVRLPLSALTLREGKSVVWPVDPETMSVSPVEVQLAGTSGEQIVVLGPIKPGQQVVTAGLHVLQAGQKVKLMGADAQGADASNQNNATKPVQVAP
jgi:RND family efflux transporter MFP subunit